MRIVLVHITLFLISGFTLGQSVDMIDAATQQCFTDRYPNLLDENHDLILAEASGINGTIDCGGYNITDLGDFTHFTSLFHLNLSEISVSNFEPLQEINLRNLLITNSSVNSLSGIQDLPDLNYLKCENCGLTAIPELPETVTILALPNNQIKEALNLADYPGLRSLGLSSNQIDTLAGLVQLTELRGLFLLENDLGYLPDLSLLDSLENVNLSFNRIPEITGLEGKTKLTSLFIGHNELNDLPGGFDFEQLVEGDISHNRLTFEDLEPLASDSNFPGAYAGYKTQATQRVEEGDARIELGDHWTFFCPFDESVASNYYFWYNPEGILIDSTASGALTLTDIADLDLGTYRCEMRNTLIPDMKIDVTGFSLTMENEALATTSLTSEPIVFSPDGDGKFELLSVEMQGTVSIYDRSGLLVNKLTGPTSWDGKDGEGAILPMGYYILVSDETTVGVTLIR